ncbi:MAG: hypothetical protein A2Z21_02070 [Candidatus Fraserbacteria bacterium RBG_16_55_9]|uniref:Uncharacterized protein n=1 Tax=Fraserbacteria sp. (strain RBG_16_55_9) TaxID=1817864 RepID=A0A1F5V1B5_FRAXR|nr:MAG: hypothetical protein A2Z21_02070 [Candidatus Fraserbacteria bacterium RBG_16_55_9]
MHSIAARHGWRGFSWVVAEAIKLYLEHDATAEKARCTLFELAYGALTPTQIDDLELLIEAVEVIPTASVAAHHSP